MFLHLGGDVVVSKEDIIAILDVRTRKAPVTKEFIEIAGDEGFIKSSYNQEKEKSFVITARAIYMSPISCITLKKRAESFLDYMC